MTLFTTFFLLTTQPPDTIHHQSDTWLAKDKALHLSISFILYTGLETLMVNSSYPQTKMRAFIATMSLGIAKEIYDRFVKKNYFSWKDLIADITGLTLAVLIH